jgi:mutual gliding-motility protein MglA
MARFDASTGEIVVRIVYDGLGTAGKTTNLRSLYGAFQSRADDDIIVPEESASGRTLYFDWLELRAGHLDAWPLRAQIVAVPGQFVYAARRYRLLQEIDGVVLVCESSESGVRAGRIAWTFLHKTLVGAGNGDVPVVLQANKQDLPGALAPEEVARRFDFEPSAITAAQASNGEGVRLTLLRILDLARARTRARLGGHPPESLPPHEETAEQMYQSLLLEDEATNVGLNDALESALAQVDPGATQK